MRKQNVRCLPPSQSTKNMISLLRAVRSFFSLLLLLLFSLSFLTERTWCRRHCWLRHREPSRDCGPRPAYPRARGRPPNIQRPGAHAARTLPVAHRTWLAHHARACRTPKRGSRRALGDRACRSVSRWRRQCQLCVFFFIGLSSALLPSSVPFGTRKKLTPRCG